MDRSLAQRGHLSPISEDPAPKRARIDPAYHCVLCRKSYIHHKTLLSHNRSPAHCKKAGLPIEQHICDQCNTSFSRPDALQRHVTEQHKGKKRPPPRRPSNVQHRASSSDVPPQPSGGLFGPGPSLPFYHTNPSIEQVLADNPLIPAMTSREPQSNDVMEPLSLVELDKVPTWPYWIPDGSHESNDYLNHFSGGASTIKPTKFSPCSFGESSAATNSTGLPSVLTGECSAATDLTEPSPMSTGKSPQSRADRYLEDQTWSGSPLPQQSPHILDVKYRSGNPVVAGRNARPYRIKFPRPCPLCRQEFGSTVDDRLKVRQHIEMHIKENNAMEVSDSEVKIECADCELQFWHIGDLEWHLRSVERGGTCGFNFAHEHSLCVGDNGHHPPALHGQRHKDHQNFLVHLEAWGRSQHREFERYVNDYGHGNVRTNAPPPACAPACTPACDASKSAYRRSTGSLFSIRSQASWGSWLSTPVYMEFLQKSLPSRNQGSIMAIDTEQHELEPTHRVKEDFANAVAQGFPDVIQQLIRLHGLLNGEITEQSLRINIDDTWFTPQVAVRKIWCLAVLFEHGMPISVDTVSRLAMLFQDQPATQYLLADVGYMKKISRLALSILCSAIGGGQVGVVLNMLNAGVRVSSKGEPQVLPSAMFMQALHEQHAGHRYSPQDMGVDWKTDYTLALALDAKSLVIADILIRQGADAYNTLTRAAQITDFATMRFLCERKVHLQRWPFRHRSDNLVSRGSPDVLHMLVNSMQSCDRLAVSPLASAEVLINWAIDVDARDGTRRTALMIICGMSHTQFEAGGRSVHILATSLLAKGADINARDKFFRTPLIHAAIAGNIDMIELLLSGGADIGLCDHKGQSAIVHAISRNHRQTAERLINQQGEPTREVFMEALRSDHRQLACFLLRQSMGEHLGRDLAEHEMRLLSSLLEYGDEDNDYHVRTVALLISSQPLTALRQPFHEALGHGKVEFVKLLLRKRRGIDVDLHQDGDIFLALQSRNPTTVLLLLEYGTNLQVIDSLGRTPLLAAVSIGCSQSVSYLLQRHVDMNDTGYGEDTPFKIALGSDLPSSRHIITLLEEFGGRLEASTSTRWSRSSRDERLAGAGGALRPLLRKSVLTRSMAVVNSIRRRQSLFMPVGITV